MDPDTTTTSPPRTPCTDGETVSPRPPTAARLHVTVVYDWIKTGKLSTRRGTGNRQRIPWTEHVEPNAAAASPNPDTSTRWPPHQIPRPTLTGPHRVGADGHHHCGRPIDQRNSISDENIPIPRLQEGHMKHPAPAIADVA